MTAAVDVNARALAGTLPADPSAGTERAKSPPRAPRQEERRNPDEPADLQAERALLGALLWAGANQPNALRVVTVRDILETGESFYAGRNVVTFDAIRACADAKQEHDPVAVYQQVLKSGRGTPTIDDLWTLVAEASTVSERQARVYAQSIRDAWIRRKTIADARALIEDAKSSKTSTTMLVDKATTIAQSVAARATSAATSLSIKQSANILWTKLGSEKKQPIFATGLRDLDSALNGGFRPREVSVVAARLNVGKSLLAAQIAEYVVTEDPTRAALYVTLEMSHEMFTARLLSARSGVPLRALRKQDLSPAQWSELTIAVSVMAEKGLYFADNPAQTLASIYAAASERARLLAKEGKTLALVVIDHLGLVKPTAESLKRANREQQVAETSRGQRFIAAELGCHVLGVAQIGRDAEKGGAQTVPRLHHLRESDSIGQDADVILILHRERDKNSGMLSTDKPAAIVLAKGRMDEPAAMVVGFEGIRSRFVDWNDTSRGFREEYGDV